ncbi:uncharacterized protein EV420DRAFT_1634515 [Desarmillaria tabescens]|uniref:Heterokaryon incompatibility domain-containing protein n=1 Tax=Armillaria tabescens TaxID=1929756 RepID=A0AA39NQQ9_ARMTA|nr:uncharacterized protein EV420DRAFT_1634515 [Desarmillaria tabescens]KAK0470086.1 hypothetical protein EV420DRAFT_1634515 [Desarmillaria tabescens]
MPNWFSKASTALAISFATLSNVRPGRLFVEDPNVKAPCWFSRRNTDLFHVPAQILRILVQVILAPIYLLTPYVVYDQISNYTSASWAFELTSTPDAVLTTAPGGGAGAYAPTGSTPRWLLSVQIVDGEITGVQQVAWSEEVRNRGYTALSYPMDSAYVLFQEAGLTVEAPSTEKRRFTLRDRKRIAERLLIEYCSATRDTGNHTEFIWLDEFCLSDITQPEDSPERSRELGRLADIFRNASQVAVFCHEENCDHTSTTCIWGTRLFTIGEILHASAVIRLTRRRQQDPSRSLKTHAYRDTARAFREQMQTKAAYDNRWHLYAIMQHSTNAGSVSWQNAIHALVVEAITRDLAGTGFEEHKFLGKALNGLLPRRARLEDLKGEDGWTDLAWLLELNQGFYNAASLAAVCSLGAGGWLGPPIRPLAGNERLEPIVHAFPVGMTEGMGIMTPLCVIGSKTVGLRDSLERDPLGLYNNKDMRGLKWLSLFILFLLWVIGLAMISVNWNFFVAIVWISSSVFVILEMMVGTIYLQRDGWIFLDDSIWGHETQQRLGMQDPKLAELIEWGDRQLIPNWSPPGEKKEQRSNGTLLDLNNGVMMKVLVSDKPSVASNKPDALIALAIHGCGVTSMLVNRTEDPEDIVRKVGMCNVPPYVLAQTVRSGTLCIGIPSEIKESRDTQRYLTEFLVHILSDSLFLMDLLPGTKRHVTPRVSILKMYGSRLTPGSRIFRRCFTSTHVPQRVFILPDFRNFDTHIPDNANAVRFRDKDKDISQVFRCFKNVEHLQFLEKNMSFVFDDPLLMDTLTKMPLKSLYFQSAIFHDINHLCSFIRRFPTVTELYCSRLRLHQKRPLRRSLLVDEGPALQTIRMDSDDLWHAALDGSFGTINEIRNITVMDVKYKQLPDIGLFLQKTAQEGNLKKFNMRHMHGFDVRGALASISHFFRSDLASDRAKGNSSWKRNPAPLELSHLKSLGIDIHGRYKLIGIKQPVVILKWWIDMLKNLAEKGQASNLKDLTIVVGICKPEPYVVEDLDGTWRLLDYLLTQDFPAFKWLRVVIKVFQPTTIENGESHKKIIEESCPRLLERKMIRVGCGHVQSSNNLYTMNNLF